MKIIAGLGNPGSEYQRTRHNAGFMFVDALADDLGAAPWRTKQDALTAEAFISGEKILLMKPLTFMNESGRAIGPALDWYRLSPEDLIVIYDDMDFPAGIAKIRKKGSAGGHNGMKSVIYHVKDDNFPRVRIGIGRPLGENKDVGHVLSAFSQDEMKKINEAINSMIPAVKCIVTDGIDLAMNRYNPKKKKAEEPDG